MAIKLTLYYTGAKTALTAQPDPRKSLGGYVSNTRIPAEKLDNLFGVYSYNELTEQKKTYRAIILKNTGDAPITNLTVGILKKSLDDNKYFVGISEVSPQNSVELIPSEDYDPDIDFDESYMEDVNDLDNSFELSASLAVGAQMCIWLGRQLQQSSNGDYCEIYNNIPTDKTIGFDLVFNYSE